MGRLTAFRRVVMALGMAGALAVGTGAAVSADEGTPNQNNYVVLFNQRDHSTLVRTSLKITYVTSGSVTAVNHAEAVASCKYCQTFAGAIEAIIVIGPVPNYQPVNEAYAVNYKCSYCDTGAYAGQFDLQYAGPVQLSERGQEQVENLREQLSSLRESELSSSALVQRVAAIRWQLETVLRNNLVPADGEGDQPRQHDRTAARAA